MASTLSAMMREAATTTRRNARFPFSNSLSMHTVATKALPQALYGCETSWVTEGPHESPACGRCKCGWTLLHAETPYPRPRGLQNY